MSSANHLPGETPLLWELGSEALPAVLELNQANLPEVSSLGMAELEALAAQAAYFRGCSVDGRLAAFLLALPPGKSYRSENYRWFSERYKEFLYIDRVATAAFARRRGIGTRLYRDIEQFAEGRGFPLIACEVNLRPPNPASMEFHRRLGYAQVGTQSTEGGEKEVAMFVKKLE